MSTLTRYLLLQIPGWLFMALVLLGLRQWIDLPLWVIGGALVLLVVKDFVLYPFVRSAYESNVRTGAERLIDAWGVAQGELNPQGYVHVAGELWRAEIEHGAAPIKRGSSVRVRDARGLTLIVTPDEPTIGRLG